MDQILARDYSNYLVQNSISQEVDPICRNIDEMLTRLDEFESLLNVVKENISVSTDKNLPEISAFQSDFSELCRRIDGFERFVGIAGDNLARMEAHLAVAEQELGYTESGLKGFLKPIFGRQKPEQEATNLSPEDVYVPPEVYNTSEFFPDSSSC
ncbi:biogenesis of lysosome-related organelles complex 1 subunit 4 [Phlebotomus argentipes]|uniref:biogenesis of lysosome-related organelles complex 1 subunit 4 n=1 Tax=Phlebotomus argentipes TaxID=94469 RepID=UPI0028930293|nr:biogenesis of lysosome-related organelles complex 1 subunit 4 [Phlebotomus argentipes]